MSTRAASATLTLRAKQHLIRVLFGSEPSKSIGVQRLRVQPDHDHSQYSYSDLRAAYLERLQKLHPDKHQAMSLGSHGSDTTSVNASATPKQSTEANVNASDSADSNAAASIDSNATSRLIELLQAWNRYEATAKGSKRVGKAESTTVVEEANFTMFGVGCSFSDTEQERELRAKIMDQASRGWLATGELGNASSTHHDDSSTITEQDSSTASRYIPLSCEELFQPFPQSDNDRQNHNEAFERDHSNDSRGTPQPRQKSCSLVSHLIPPHRR
jgi:hypothetical protein